MKCPHYQKEGEKLKIVYKEELGEEEAETDQDKFIKNNIVKILYYATQFGQLSSQINKIKELPSTRYLHLPINYKSILHSGRYL